MSETIVRPATYDDLPQMLVNAESFLKETGYVGIPFDGLSMEGMLGDCITAGLCFIAEQDGLHIGGIGAIIAALPVNQNIEVAIERFFWIVPDDRAKGLGSKLLAALKDAAKSAGCERLLMVALVNAMLPLVEKLYLREGFEPRERTYEMRL